MATKALITIIEVLEHFKEDINPLKGKVALFLFDNLKDRYTIKGKHHQAYSDSIKEYYQNAVTLHEKLISVSKKAYNDSVVKDITALNPGYLIDNIDLAFMALEKAGWKDQVSFAIFCEFILPYRIGNEPLENWRKEVLQDSILKVTGDSIFSFVDLKTAATYLSQNQSKFKDQFLLRWAVNSATIHDLPFSTHSFLMTGTCSNLSLYSMFACRAAAILIANDFTPNWADFAPRYELVAIITKTTPVPYILPIKDSLDAYKHKDKILTKVYRHIFSENTNSHLWQRGFCEFLPGLFNNPRLLKVTDLSKHTFEISIPFLIKSGENKFVYIAAPKRDNWAPVGWGKVKNGLASFPKVGMSQTRSFILSQTYQTAKQSSAQTLIGQLSNQTMKPQIFIKCEAFNN